jgi:hypothetical protein
MNSIAPTDFTYFICPSRVYRISQGLKTIRNMSQQCDSAREGSEQLDELDFLNRCDSLPADDCLDLDGGDFGGGDRGDETWLMASARRPHRSAPVAAAATLGGPDDPKPASPSRKRRGGTATGTSASHRKQQQLLHRHSSLVHAKHTNGQPRSPQSPVTATKGTFPPKSQTNGGPQLAAGTSPATSAAAPHPQRSPPPTVTTPPPLATSRSPSQANVVALSSATPQPRRQLFNAGGASAEKDRGPSSAGVRPNRHYGGATTARDLVASSERAPTHASRSHRSSSAGEASPQPSRQGGSTAVKQNSSHMLHHTTQQGNGPAATTSAVAALLSKRTLSSPTARRSVIERASGNAHERGVVVLSLQSSSAAHRTSSAVPHAPSRSTVKPPLSSERRSANGVGGQCVKGSPPQRALSAGRGGSITVPGRGIELETQRHRLRHQNHATARTVAPRVGGVAAAHGWGVDALHSRHCSQHQRGYLRGKLASDISHKCYRVSARCSHCDCCT